jgi:hypothetical protein
MSPGTSSAGRRRPASRIRNAIRRRSAVRTNGSVPLIRMKMAEVEQANTPRKRSRYLANIAPTLAYPAT